MNYVIGGVVGVLVLLGGWYALNLQESGEGARAERIVSSEEPLVIATSFYPLQFALERIVGDLGEVTNIGAGRDPHDFRPSTQDVLQMQRADFVVLQGAGLEPWGDDVVKQLEADNVPVVIATADIALHEGGHEHGEDEHHDDEHGEEHKDEHEAEHDEDEHGHEHEEDHHDDDHAHEDVHEEGDHHEDEHAHGAYDPHTWLDPVLFSETVAHLTEAIVAFDPNNAAVYEANAAALQAELAELHNAYEGRLASCELDEVITSHDAFGYVADRYSFTVHTIAGLSTQDTPSALTLAALREEAAEGIGAILLEDNSVIAYGETLARETGLRTLSINPIAHSIPSGETYLSLMQANLETLADAMNCNG